MTYSEAIDKINSTLKFGISPGLDRISKLLNLLGNPQEKLKYIHVTGTNGKGSTCKMVSSVLIESGLKVGLFTSPFVVDFCERIKINNNMITKKEVANLVETLIPYVNIMAQKGYNITEFELITAMAFKWFCDCKCDIVVLEVGLGGRFDATNVIKTSVVSVITSISLDHINILGNTVEKIAYEKAGIIKPNTSTVLGIDIPQEAENIINEIAAKQNNHIIKFKISDITVINQTINFTKMLYNDIQISLPLIGKHQIKNALTALNVLKVINQKGIPISHDDIKNGFKKLEFEARCEILSKEPLMLLDGAHNPDGAKALKDVIKTYCDDKPIIGIIGMLSDKNIEGFLSCLAPRFSHLICVPIQNSRAIDFKELKNKTQKYCNNSIAEYGLKEALKNAVNLAGNSGTVIICGSLYLAHEIRPLIIDFLNK